MNVTNLVFDDRLHKSTVAPDLTEIENGDGKRYLPSLLLAVYFFPLFKKVVIIFFLSS